MLLTLKWFNSTNDPLEVLQRYLIGARRRIKILEREIKTIIMREIKVGENKEE